MLAELGTLFSPLQWTWTPWVRHSLWRPLFWFGNWCGGGGEKADFLRWGAEGGASKTSLDFQGPNKCALKSSSEWRLLNSVFRDSGSLWRMKSKTLYPLQVPSSDSGKADRKPFPRSNHGGTPKFKVAWSFHSSPAHPGSWPSVGTGSSGRAWI